MKKPKSKVFLSITTWAGTFGMHYYGSFWYNGKREDDVRWIPPEKHRKMLNELEYEKFSKLKKGEDTIKFLREYDLIEEAKKQWKKRFPKAEILIKGNPMSVHDDIDESLILDKKKETL